MICFPSGVAYGCMYLCGNCKILWEPENRMFPAVTVISLKNFGHPVLKLKQLVKC